MEYFENCFPNFSNKYRIKGKIKDSDNCYLISKFNNLEIEDNEEEEQVYFLKIHKSILYSNKECKEFLHNIKILENIEIINNSRLNHFNKIHFLESSENKNDFLIVYDFLGNSIKKIFKSKEDLDFNIKLYWTFQLILILEILNDLKLIHLNLCIENIYSTKEGVITLNDFRFAVQEGIIKDTCLKEYNSSRYYKSPEVLLNHFFLTTKSDIWSLGCVLHEIFYGKVLFKCNSIMEHFIKIIDVCGEIEKEDLLSIPFAEGFITNLTQFNFKSNSMNKKSFIEKKKCVSKSVINRRSALKDKLIIQRNSQSQKLKIIETKKAGKSNKEIKEKIHNLIFSCLRFNPEKRISIKKLKDLFSESFPEIKEIYNNKIEVLEEGSENIFKQKNIKSFWDKINLNLNDYNKVIEFKEEFYNINLN